MILIVSGLFLFEGFVWAFYRCSLTTTHDLEGWWTTTTEMTHLNTLEVPMINNQSYYHQEYLSHEPTMPLEKANLITYNKAYLSQSYWEAISTYYKPQNSSIYHYLRWNWVIHIINGKWIPWPPHNHWLYLPNYFSPTTIKSPLHI